MSMFKRNRNSEARIDVDETIAKGTFENNAQAFDPNNPNRAPRIEPVAQHWSVDPAAQDEIRNAPLTPIPEPGLAVFEDMLSYSLKPHETLLMMKPNWKVQGFDVDDITNNQPPKAMFTIGNPSPKLKPKSSKRVFSSASNGTKLCDFEKITHKLHATYRALDPNTKSPLVEVTMRKNSEEITGTMTILLADALPASAMTFSNEIDDGTGKGSAGEGNAAPTLEWKGHATELRGMIEYQGNLVATIEKKFLITTTEYHLRIAPGLDPFLVCIMAAAVEDRRRASESWVPFGGLGSMVGA